MATTNPIIIPNTNELIMTENASYMKTLLLCFYVRPTALRTPNSQMFSLMFWDVEISNKKNANIKAIRPIISTNSSTTVRVYVICFNN